MRVVPTEGEGWGLQRYNKKLESYGDVLYIAFGDGFTDVNVSKLSKLYI